MRLRLIARLIIFLSIASAVGTAAALNDFHDQSAERDVKRVPCGRFGSLWLPIDPTARHPSHYPLYWQSARYEGLIEVLDGYQKTRVPLIASDGQQFWPAGHGDDVGLYLNITFLAAVLGLSLDNSIRFVLIGMCLAGVISGLLGFWQILSSTRLKWFALGEIVLLSALVVRLSDVYIASFAVVIGLIPWILHFRKRKRKGWAACVLFSLGAGIAIAFAESFRVTSGTTVFVFMGAVILLTKRWSWLQRGSLIAAVVLGAFLVELPIIHFQHKRDTFLSEHVASYTPIGTRHGLWMPIYLGLGFLNNPDHGGYCDEVATAKVRSVDPSVAYASPEFDRILKLEILPFVLAHMKFSIMNMLAKLGVVVVALIVAMNLGLTEAIRHPKDLATELPFWISILFSVIAPLLTIPLPQYLLGAAALGVCYSLISMDHAHRKRDEAPA